MPTSPPLPSWQNSSGKMGKIHSVYGSRIPTDLWYYVGPQFPLTDEDATIVKAEATMQLCRGPTAHKDASAELLPSKLEPIVGHAILHVHRACFLHTVLHVGRRNFHLYAVGRCEEPETLVNFLTPN